MGLGISEILFGNFTMVILWTTRLLYESHLDKLGWSLAAGYCYNGTANND